MDAISEYISVMLRCNDDIITLLSFCQKRYVVTLRRLYLEICRLKHVICVRLQNVLNLYIDSRPLLAVKVITYNNDTLVIMRVYTS